jgi:pimeloyl-ACP methyl ester carboxylesterase
MVSDVFCRSGVRESSKVNGLRPRILSPLLLLAACGAAVRLPEGGAYTVVRGLSTYYRERGRGEVVLLLHGGSGNSENFGAQFPALGAHYRVIAPDRQGQGRTADVDRPLHYHDMAEDTVALMDRLHVARADLVGWSDGGNLALDLALHHPARVHRMVLSGANFRADGLLDDTIAAIRSSTPRTWPAFLRRDYERLSPDGPGHWPIVFAKLKAMFLGEPNLTIDDLHAITAPTLVIVGEHDLIKPEHTRTLVASLGSAALCVIPREGHMVPMQNPRLWNRAVLEFLGAGTTLRPAGCQDHW